MIIQSGVFAPVLLGTYKSLIPKLEKLTDIA